MDKLAEMRKKHIQEHIEESYALLKEYEDSLRLASDPKEILRYRREIARLQEEITRYGEELHGLKSDEPAHPKSPERAINTGGGAYVEGNVYAGTFVGRDQTVTSPKSGSKVTPARQSASQERIASLKRQHQTVLRSINYLEEMRVKYGANVPLEILNQLDDARQQLERIERELKELGGLD